MGEFVQMEGPYIEMPKGVEPYDEVKLGRITGAQLGLGDHGLSCAIDFQYEGGAQSFCGHALLCQFEPVDTTDDEQRKRAAAAMDWVLRALLVFGPYTMLHHFKGHTAYVFLRKGLIYGMQQTSLTVEAPKGQPFHVEEWAQKWGYGKKEKRI